MTPRPEDELRRIADTGDLHLSPFREDGVTYGTPTWLWPVVVGGDLYVRASNGRHSRWSQAVLRRAEGRITAAGLTRQVTSEPVDGEVQGRIDAYRAKSGVSPSLSPMSGARARAATVRVRPREAQS